MVGTNNENQKATNENSTVPRNTATPGMFRLHIPPCWAYHIKRVADSEASIMFPSSFMLHIAALWFCLSLVAAQRAAVNLGTKVHPTNAFNKRGTNDRSTSGGYFAGETTTPIAVTSLLVVLGGVAVFAASSRKRENVMDGGEFSPLLSAKTNRLTLLSSTSIGTTYLGSPGVGK